MRYTLLENGIDSLKATAHSLERFADAGDLAELPYHHMKDAILSINHANEILFKCLLQREQEHLIYRDFNLFMQAKKQMKERGLSNVMDTTVTLNTVNTSEALDRLEYICDYEIEQSYKRLLLDLNKTRNKLMHYELVLDEVKAGSIGFKVMRLYEKTENFFKEHFSDFSILLSGAREELTYEEYYEQYEDEAFEAYLGRQEDYEAEMMELAEAGRGAFGLGNQ